MRKPRKKPKVIRVYTRFFAYKKWELEKSHPKGKRFFPWLYMTLVLPWALIWKWLRHDWRLFIVFGAWCAIVSCEVWVPYLLGFITGNDYWFGIGSAWWLAWAGPGTPFLAIVLALTIGTEAIWKGIKALLRKRKEKRK